MSTIPPAPSHGFHSWTRVAKTGSGISYFKCLGCGKYASTHTSGIRAKLPQGDCEVPPLPNPPDDLKDFLKSDYEPSSKK